MLLASNHRSFSDPFMIGTCLGRPLRFVAKVELFEKRWQARLLLALGAFPIRRGESDELAMETARVILERGGAVGMFPEGTRVRPGPLGEPKRGIGRLALETGRAGRARGDHRHRGHSPWLAHSPAPGDHPLRPRTQFPAPGRRRRDSARRPGDLRRESGPACSSSGNGSVEWLRSGRQPSSAPAAGAQRQRCCSHAEGPRSSSAAARPSRPLRSGAAAATTHTCPVWRCPTASRRRPPTSSISRRSTWSVSRSRPERSAETVDQLADRLPSDADVLLLTKGLVAPDAQLPCDYLVGRTGSRSVALLGGPAHAAEACRGEAGLVVASPDRAFAARLAGVFAERRPALRAQRRHRRRPARGLREERGRAGGRPCASRRRQRRRCRRGPHLRRVPPARALDAVPGRELHRAGRCRRPGRDRARLSQPQPARRRAARRRGHRARGRRARSARPPRRSTSCLCSPRRCGIGASRHRPPTSSRG